MLLWIAGVMGPALPPQPLTGDGVADGGPAGCQHFDVLVQAVGPFDDMHREVGDLRDGLVDQRQGFAETFSELVAAGELLHGKGKRFVISSHLLHLLPGIVGA